MRGLFICAAAVLLFPADAWAYSAAARYDQESNLGGGGGRFFTGSARDNFTCGVCHEGTVEGADLKVGGFPVSGYTPGQVYPIRLTWDPGPLTTMEDTFAVVGEVASVDGEPMGSIELPATEDAEADSLCASGVAAARVFETQDGRDVVTMTPCGAKQLRFFWTAPEASGDVDACAPDAVFYMAAMQGDASEDPSGDALTLDQKRVRSVSACEDEDEAADGCRVGTGPSGAPLLLVVLAALRRRRKRTACG